MLFFCLNVVNGYLVFHDKIQLSQEFKRLSKIWPKPTISVQSPCSQCILFPKCAALLLCFVDYTDSYTSLKTQAH